MSFGEILVTAFILQLTALPGEKGQLVIASLATRYNPYMVVAGAATAFGGWTALEILLGNALKGALPVVYLDGLTAALFVLFAGWLLYGAADGEGDAIAQVTDGDGRFAAIESAIPPRLRGFVPSFSLMVVGEFGDKTQLVTIGLAIQYGASAAIWLGEMLAIVPVSLATALVFHRTADRLDTTAIHRLAAGIFLLFAADIVAGYTLGVSLLPL